MCFYRRHRHLQMSSRVPFLFRRKPDFFDPFAIHVLNAPFVQTQCDSPLDRFGRSRLFEPHLLSAIYGFLDRDRIVESCIPAGWDGRVDATSMDIHEKRSEIYVHGRPLSQYVWKVIVFDFDLKRLRSFLCAPGRMNLLEDADIVFVHDFSSSTAVAYSCITGNVVANLSGFGCSVAYNPSNRTILNTVFVPEKPPTHSQIMSRPLDDLDNYTIVAEFSDFAPLGLCVDCKQGQMYATDIFGCVHAFSLGGERIGKCLERDGELVELTSSFFISQSRSGILLYDHTGRLLRKIVLDFAYYYPCGRISVSHKWKRALFLADGCIVAIDLR